MKRSPQDSSVNRDGPPGPATPEPAAEDSSSLHRPSVPVRPAAGFWVFQAVRQRLSPSTFPLPRGERNRLRARAGAGAGSLAAWQPPCRGGSGGLFLKISIYSKTSPRSARSSSSLRQGPGALGPRSVFPGPHLPRMGQETRRPGWDASPGELTLPLPPPASGQDPGCHATTGITASPPDLPSPKLPPCRGGHHFEGQTLEI